MSHRDKRCDGDRNIIISLPMYSTFKAKSNNIRKPVHSLMYTEHSFLQLITSCPVICSLRDVAHKSASFSPFLLLKKKYCEVTLAICKNESGKSVNELNGRLVLFCVSHIVNNHHEKTNASNELSLLTSIVSVS